jgi:hypothetical protein
MAMVMLYRAGQEETSDAPHLMVGKQLGVRYLRAFFPINDSFEYHEPK